MYSLIFRPISRNGLVVWKKIVEHRFYFEFNPILLLPKQDFVFLIEDQKPRFANILNQHNLIIQDRIAHFFAKYSCSCISSSIACFIMSNFSSKYFLYHSIISFFSFKVKKLLRLMPFKTNVMNCWTGSICGKFSK